MIEQQDVKRQYPVSGGTATSAGTVFPFNIRFFDKQDVVCFLYNPTTEVEETLIPGIDYTVEDKEDYSSGANVTLTKNTAGSNTLTIVRSVVPKQDVHMPNFGRIPSESLETQMDRTVAVVQQLQDEMKQIYAMPYGVSGSVTPAQAIKDLVGGGGGGSSGGSAAYADSAGTATVASALVSGATAGYAESAGSASTAGVASALVEGATAGYAAVAGSIDGGVAYAEAAGTAANATNAGYATNAGNAGYATNAGNAGYASNAGSASEAGVASALVEGATAGYAAVAGSIDGGVAYAEAAGTAGYANSAGAFQYNGPFAVEGDISSDTVLVSSGAVVVGSSRYEVPAAGATVPPGYDLYLSGSSYETSSGIAASFGYVYSSGTVESSDPNTFLTRIAHNLGGGVVQQYQYGDIVTVPWGISGSGGGTIISSAYKGPFRVSATTSDGTTLNVTVRPGTVVVGSKRYDTPWLPHSPMGSTLSGTITLPSGYDLYLMGRSNTSTGGVYFDYVTTNGVISSTSSGAFLTKLAYNSGGVVQQYQHGEITTVPWGIQGGTTSTTISGVMWPDLARKNSVSAGSAGVAPDGGWILGHMTCNAGNLGNQAYVIIYNSSTVAAATGSRMIELIGGMVASGATSETVSIDAAISIPIPAGGRFEFTENADSNTISWEYLKVHPIVGGEAIEMETNP